MAKQGKTAVLDAWFMVDAEGTYVIGRTLEEMREEWDNREGCTPAASAVYHERLVVPLPRAIDITASIPDAPTDDPLELIITRE